MWMVHIKSAIVTLRRSKWRSTLTMLGVVVGVASVVTAVSLGEGVKRQVTAQISQLGPDIITVLPQRVESGTPSGLSIAGQVGQTFSEQDVRTIQDVSGLRYVVPLSLLSGVAEANGVTFNASIVATTSDLPLVFNQQVAFGNFFDNASDDKEVAVIGRTVAQELFDENAPIGKALTIRGREFRVRAVFQEFETSPLTPGLNYNRTIFIPPETARNMLGSSLTPYQVLVKPVNEKQVDQVAADITTGLQRSHGGSIDFSVLKQEQNLATANSVLNILTGLVASIAAISLFVGGIGIMNIMLLSVSERYHEIGVRKAVGATNQQILSQFLTEASLVSFSGGVIGVLIALLANYFMRVFTDLQPVVTWQISLLAVAAAMVVGIIFGVIPAWQAAKKDPIEALRHE